MARKVTAKPLSAKAQLIKKMVTAAHAPTPAEERERAFQHIAAQISEYFDAAYLTVSWMENGETFAMDVALGNKYAAHGMVKEAAAKIEAIEVDPYTEDPDDAEEPA